MTTKVNSCFGTSFVPLAHDDGTNSSAVPAEIDSHDRSWFGDEVAIRTARPTREKELHKESIRQELGSSALRPLLADCEQVHRRLLAAGAPDA